MHRFQELPWALPLDPHQGSALDPLRAPNPQLDISTHTLITYATVIKQGWIRAWDLREDIKQYQNTLSYASSKVNYSVGENIYILGSNINLNIKSGTVWYNNKILVSDSRFSLGKNNMVNATVPEKTSPIVPKHANETVIIYAPSKHTSAITHEEERVAFY